MPNFLFNAEGAEDAEGREGACTKAIVLFAIRDSQIRLIIDNSKPEITIEPALLQVLIGIDYGKICQPQIFAKGDMTL